MLGSKKSFSGLFKVVWELFRKFQAIVFGLKRSTFWPKYPGIQFYKSSVQNPRRKISCLKSRDIRYLVVSFKVVKIEHTHYLYSNFFRASLWLLFCPLSTKCCHRRFSNSPQSSGNLVENSLTKKMTPYVNCLFPACPPPPPNTLKREQ